jgi:hypothetical protein
MIPGNERQLQQHVAYLLEQAYDVLLRLPTSPESTQARLKILDASGDVEMRILALSPAQVGASSFCSPPCKPGRARAARALFVDSEPASPAIHS